jgi:DNA-binding response OmpR family regulator
MDTHPHPLKIMIVEDSDDIRLGWMLYLQAQGHCVKAVAMAAELLDEAGAFTPDVYLVDLNLPDADGLDLVRQLRAVHPSVGIVITTARSQIGDKVVGYESGADLYFTKPIAPEELLAGLLSLTRRRHAATDAQGLRLRHAQDTLLGPAGEAVLTPAETKLLAGLVRAGGQPLAKWQIGELLGLQEAMPSEAVVEMRVTRLRRKLQQVGAEPPAIRAMYGRGYLLACGVVIE